MSYKDARRPSCRKTFVNSRQGSAFGQWLKLYSLANLWEGVCLSVYSNTHRANPRARVRLVPVCSARRRGNGTEKSTPASETLKKPGFNSVTGKRCITRCATLKDRFMLGVFISGVMYARRIFGEHERKERVAQGAAKSNSSFLGALQTSQVHT